MILTAHLLAGAVIASKIQNPALALPIALLSHYLCDSLPHKDYSIANIHQRQWSKTFPEFLLVFADIFLGSLIILFVAGINPVILLGAFLAILPDSVTLLGQIFTNNKIIKLHQKIHMAVNTIGDSEKNKKIPLFLGIINQAAIAVAAIFAM